MHVLLWKTTKACYLLFDTVQHVSSKYGNYAKIDRIAKIIVKKEIAFEPRSSKIYRVHVLLWKTTKARYLLFDTVHHVN